MRRRRLLGDDRGSGRPDPAVGNSLGIGGAGIPVLRQGSSSASADREITPAGSSSSLIWVGGHHDGGRSRLSQLSPDMATDATVAADDRVALTTAHALNLPATARA